MATKKDKAPKFDFARLLSDFQNLDTKNPYTWPLAPRILLCLAIIVIVVVGCWFAFLNGYDDDLVKEQNTEQTLRDDYKKKLVKAVSLDALKQQRVQIEQYVLQLEKQLPSKAEMAALLSDMNQAGLGRSLKFELFRPGDIAPKEYYAELPITVRVVGKFHDMGEFVSDVAKLSRIVTLNNLSIAPKEKDTSGNLTMETMARTFRYLDPDEIEAQKAATAKGKGKK